MDAVVEVLAHVDGDAIRLLVVDSSAESLAWRQWPALRWRWNHHRVLRSLLIAEDLRPVDQPADVPDDPRGIGNRRDEFFLHVDDQ